MLRQTESESRWSLFGVAPSILAIPALTILFATLVGFLIDDDRWIYWILSAGCIGTVVWAVLFWPLPVLGSTGRTARISLLAGLGLLAVGQLLLGLVEAKRATATEDVLIGLNNAGATFGLFGTLLGGIGLVMTIALVFAVRFEWTSGWKLGVLFVGVGVVVIVLISAIVTMF